MERTVRTIVRGKTLRRNTKVVSTIAVLLLGLLSYQAVGAQADEAKHQAQLLRSSDRAGSSEYVVLYQDGATSTKRALPNFGGRSVTQLGSKLGGFITELSNDEVLALQNDSNVEYIIQDFSFRAPSFGSNTPTPPAAPAIPWGLDRIDQRVGIDNSFNPDGTGAGVDIYIMDTGIQAEHEQFGGRVVGGVSFSGDSSDPFDDCKGHGTGVASIAAGRTLGVARQANLYSVKVGGCDNDLSFRGIVASTDWILNVHSGPSVVNMSFGAEAALASTAFTIMVDKLTEAGIVVVTAAGNGPDNACQWSPADAAAAITVGSTDRSDTKASQSNFGSCVDLFAPGDDISIADPNGTITSDSGTSLAAPMVAGAAALYMEEKPAAAPRDVRNYLNGSATSDVIGDVNGSPNLLLYVGHKKGVTDCQDQSTSEWIPIDSDLVPCVELPDGTNLLDSIGSDTETNSDWDGNTDSGSNLDWGDILDNVAGESGICYGPVKPGPELNLAKAAFEAPQAVGGCGTAWNDQLGHQCHWVDGWQCFGDVPETETPGSEANPPIYEKPMQEVEELEQPQSAAVEVDNQPIESEQPELDAQQIEPNEATTPTICRSEVVEGFDLEQAQAAFARPMNEGGCGVSWNDQELGHQCEWISGTPQGWRCFGALR